MHEPESADRKLHLGWITAAVCALLFAMFLFQLLGPSPTIVVSKDTTFITEPLRDDGLPDYEAYWIQQTSDGITPDNNAAPLIWRALWPGDLAEEYWLPLCEALGMDKVPSSKEALVEPYDESVSRQVARDLAEFYAKSVDEQLKAEDYFSDEWQSQLSVAQAQDAIEAASMHPWTSDRLPALAAWIEHNQRPLDLLIEASERPRYFSPAPSMLDNSHQTLIEMLLPDIQMMRTAARALPIRAMWHLGENRPMQAWQNLLACHRLARLAGENNTLVGQLVAIAVDGIACRGTQVLLHHGDLSTEQLRQISKDLQSLDPTSDCARAIEEGERFSFLDVVLHVATGNTGISEFMGISNEPMHAMSMARIDWNSILRKGNEWYDKFVNAAKIPERENRIAALEQIEIDLSGVIGQTRSPSTLLSGLFTQSRRSEIVGNLLLGMMIPATRSAVDAEDRGRVVFELTQLAAALAIYHAAQGEYPEQLTDLVPGVLQQVPADIYSGKPFVYRRKADGGYLLYSVFGNGIDDGGTDFDGDIINGEWVEKQPVDFDYHESDIVIRVPFPAFQLPPPPSVEELEYGYGGP